MPLPPPPPIRACLFDMDGLLIDSEDIYTLCTNSVLHEYNRPSLPWNIKAKLQGRPGPSAGAIFSQWAQLPISREEYMSKIAALQAKEFPKTRPLPGVETLLQDLGRAVQKGGLQGIALATSSHAGNFKLKTGHLQELFSVFPEEHRVLGDDKRIPPGRGKPAPEIYLLALETINTRLRREGKEEVKPEECLVFEDSVPGVESGRRAGMQVVWCPHEGLLNEMRGKEGLILAGLMKEGEEEDGQSKDAEIGTVVDGGRRRVMVPPGQVGDGWGRLYASLEGFPYKEYGIVV